MRYKESTANRDLAATARAGRVTTGAVPPSWGTAESGRFYARDNWTGEFTVGETESQAAALLRAGLFL